MTTKNDKVKDTKKSTNKREDPPLNTKKDTKIGIRLAGVITIALISFFFPHILSFFNNTNYDNNTVDVSQQDATIKVPNDPIIQTDDPIVMDPKLEETVQVPKDPIHHIKCSDANLKNFLHISPQVGMHVLCLIPQHDDETKMKLVVYHQASDLEITISNNLEKTWTALKEAIMEELNLSGDRRPTRNRQPYAIFTTRGQRIVGGRDIIIENNNKPWELIQKSEMVLLFEGGAWMWPGVREGFKRVVDLYTIMPELPIDGEEGKPTFEGTNTQVEIETLSLEPLVLSVPGFISMSECDHIQQKSSPYMAKSGVSLMDHDQGKDATEWRTSETHFLSARSDNILIDLERRTASLVRQPRNHQEDFQVLKYKKHGKYDHHHDWFNPSLYQKDRGTLELIQNGKRNRLATVFCYLSDVEEGGHTAFPRYNGLPQPHSINGSCNNGGLKVKPEKGKVIIFYNLKANGDGDDLSLHAACPVEGENDVKWAANKWVWNAPMHFV